MTIAAALMRDGMKTMTARKFKAQCLAVMDEVQSKRVTVVITKRGKPVAKLAPVEPKQDEIFGFYKGKGKIKGDIVKPVFTLREWGTVAGRASQARDYETGEKLGLCGGGGLV
jgi:prevent-host-death family protein